jgi:hypothetical protein
LAAPDVVLHQNAGRFPASFQALAPGSPSALAERGRQDVLQVRQVLQPLAAQKKVESQTDLRAPFQQAPLAAARWAQPSAVPWVRVDESVSAPEASLLVEPAKRVLQPVEHWSASRQEPKPAPSERQARRPERSIREQPEPGPQEQQAARLAQRERQLAWLLAQQRAPQV